jgi:hypothetical protein
MTKQNKARLLDLLLKADMIIHPNLPNHARVLEVFPDTNEKDIKKNIKKFCEIMKFMYKETDSAAKRVSKSETMTHPSGREFEKVTSFYKKSNLEKGHHDIEIGKNNIAFCIEIKAQNKKTKYKDRQSKVQKEFEIKLKDDFGFDYYIIRGMDDFLDLFDNVVLPKITTHH